VRPALRDRCLGCHEPLAKRLAAPGATVHAPVAESCGRCHDPHASGRRKLLATAVPALCAECHDLAAGAAAQAHAPYAAAPGRCTSCHDPHVSSARGLLGAVSHPPFADRECATCHLAPTTGRPAVKERIAATCAECHDDPKSSGHRPVREGRCVTCHTPHASSRPHLLVETGVALCEPCHDRRGQRWKKLHADAGAEGSDCLDCHDAHMKKKK